MLAAGALALAGCNRSEPITAAHTPPLDMDLLNRAIPKIAARLLPGRLGVGFMNLDSGQVWTHAGERPFPMQSVFKAPLASAVLAEIDAGRLSLDASFTLKDMDLSPWSPIAAAWPARTTFTARELLTVAIQANDNTAADVLMARIGGPGAVSAFLTGKRINEIHVDRYEREIQTEMLGMSPFRPAWRTPQAFQAARATVPAAQRARALAAYLADPRDTATPRSLLHWLHELDDGELIAPASRSLLLQLMSGVSAGEGRIKAGLPKGSSLAHKTGTGPVEGGVVSAMNDAGIFTLPDRRRYSLAVFISGAPLSPDACAAAIADIARAAVRAAR
jgi:beta-lactamase class A